MSWSGGLAVWRNNNTAYISIAFTWKLDEAYSCAVWERQQGRKVMVGGPGTFTRKNFFDGVATRSERHPDAIWQHNPQATMASRGCPVGCWFCIVPKMEGKDFTLIPDFPVRPILCDNNLSGLPEAYQDHIIHRYQQEEVPLLDANSGFEPQSFNEDTYRRWKTILKGPWRFAYDEQEEREYVKRMMDILKDESPGRKRVYVLIGNESQESCLQRLQEVISWGGEPHAQPVMKLKTLTKSPWIGHDWDRQSLTDMARWANRRIWRYVEFDGYQKHKRTAADNEAAQMRLAI